MKKRSLLYVRKSKIKMSQSGLLLLILVLTSVTLLILAFFLDLLYRIYQYQKDPSTMNQIVIKQRFEFLSHWCCYKSRTRKRRTENLVLMKVEIPEAGMFMIGPHRVYLTRHKPSSKRLMLELNCILDVYDHEMRRGSDSIASSCFEMAVSEETYVQYQILLSNPEIAEGYRKSSGLSFLSRIRWCNDIYQAYLHDLSYFYMSVRE
jgi:hypothetical protein